MRGTHYLNRMHAGEELAARLLSEQDGPAVVLAVPRGGVPVAVPVARALGCSLDLIIPRKIGAPGQPEVAIGAVCEDGEILLNPLLVQQLQISDDYINTKAAQAVSEIKRRLFVYRGEQAAVDVRGKTVIMIDDGVATGFTITAALQSVRRLHPKKLILAIPVAPPNTIATLFGEVERVICPLQPEEFSAVGQFYDQFPQLTDRDVIQLLASVGTDANRS
ncbi:MAG: phosphoribosyltransferase family protein [Firmicutes bacterium]|nr:phosphoribosyltransferase family protein [Bacillota bacterium]